MRWSGALVLLGACGEPALEPAPVPMEPVTTVTFNVAGSANLEDPTKGTALADELVALAPDFIELEECSDCDALFARMPDTYALSPDDSFEVQTMYRADAWDVDDDGSFALGNDDGWGERQVRWTRFASRASGGVVYVYATHWCVPIRNDTDTCDTDRQLEVADEVLDAMADRPGAAILGGDLNVFDGFEQGPVIARFEAAGLIDTLREVTDEPVDTFDGNSWAPAGRIDYVLSTGPVDVLDAAVGADSVSDHRTVSATLQFR